MTMRTAYIDGISNLSNGEYKVPERDMAYETIRNAINDANTSLGSVDGLYMPKPRPWTPQGFFSTFLSYQLGVDLDRTLEVYTGGTSGGTAFQSAVSDIQQGNIDSAIVLAVERNSIIETDRYFEYILGLFDQEFQSPVGPSIPGVYAMSLQRYCHQFDINRRDLASVVVKNRENAAENPDAFFDSGVTIDEVMESRLVADPLRLFECPMPCDGAAAIVLGSDPAPNSVRVAGSGYYHAPSHLIGHRDGSMATFPAIGHAAEEALSEADLSISQLDVLEPYAPFPHVEAIMTEELGLFDRGAGIHACKEGKTAMNGLIPVSPSGGCLGRGHPAMVTPLLNHIAAVKQIQGTANNQVPKTESVMTTSEHGHVDGVTSTVFTAREKSR